MCTAFLLPYDGGVLLGRNMDYEDPLRYGYRAFDRGSAVEDVDGHMLPAQYAYGGMIFEGTPPVKDGMNEAGLCGLVNIFRGVSIHAPHPAEGYRNISSLHVLSYLLATCGDVHEVRLRARTLRLSMRNSHGQRVIAPDFQFLFADASGHSLLLEPLRGQLVPAPMPYSVLTNSPRMESHVRRLEKLLGRRTWHQVSAKDLPGGFDPFSRLVRAAAMRSEVPETMPLEEALASLASLLDALKIPRGFLRLEGNADATWTRYQVMYAPAEGTIYLRGHGMLGYRTFRMQDALAEKAPPTYMDGGRWDT